MADKEIERVEVRVADKGGYIVRQSYRRRPVKRGGGLRADIAYDYPESDEIVFGAAEGHKMLSYIARTLKMGKVAEEETAEDKAGGE